MKKINFQKLNSSFFFIGIIASVILQLINTTFMKFNWLILALSIVAVTICFYRFNNGLIALIRGRFGKPRKSDLHFVDYDEVKYKDEIKAEIGDSLLVYKLNSRDAYQIIKQNERLLIRKCFISNDINECVYEADLSNADSLKFAKGDISIRYESIDKITYKISPTNYYTPIIEIKVGKKTYRYIGLLEEFDFETIKSFFDDVCTVKQNKNKKKLKAEKGSFLFKILNLGACLVVPNILLSSLNEAKGFAHIISSCYMLIGVVILVLYILLPIINPTKYGFEIDESTTLSNQSYTFLGMMLVNFVILSSVVMHQSVLNTALYVILVAVLTVVLAYLFIKKASFKIKDDGKLTKHLSIFVVVLFVAISCTSIISGLNYTIPLKSYSQTYTIKEKYIETTSHGNELYYATVRFDGKDVKVKISSDVYESNSNHIQLVRTRGILGIEYITEDISDNN